MQGVVDIYKINETLTESHKTRVPARYAQTEDVSIISGDGFTEPVVLTGVIFADPSTEAAKTHILNHAIPFHIRSDHHMDLFWAGYSEEESAVEAYRRSDLEYPNLNLGMGRRFAYSPFIAEAMRNYFIEEADLSMNEAAPILLLLNTRLTSDGRGIELDLSHGLKINVDTETRVGKFNDALDFMTHIFEIAEQNNRARHLARVNGHLPSRPLAEVKADGDRARIARGMKNLFRALAAQNPSPLLSSFDGWEEFGTSRQFPIV